MLKTRVITALLALIIMLLVFSFSSPFSMQLIFLGLVGIGTWEIASMVMPKIYERSRLDPSISCPTLLISCIVLIAGLIFALNVFTEQYGMVGIILGMLGGLMIGVFAASDIELSFGTAAGILVCLVYGVFPWLAIWELYRFSPDSRYIYFLCVIVWSGDTGAYFVGRTFGSRKLAPRMSPNKTWEGAIGGILASFLGAVLFKLCLSFELPDWHVVVLCSLIGGALGQLGDLTESTFKRFAGVKDSGKIFPGHGGFLDRVDGLLFAAPAIWFILFHFGI